MAVKENQIGNQILEKIRNSDLFFSIMESLLSIGSEETKGLVLRLLSYVGDNKYFRNLILDKLGKFNISPEILIAPENQSQSLLYLNYSNIVFLDNLKFCFMRMKSWIAKINRIFWMMKSRFVFGLFDSQQLHFWLFWIISTLLKTSPLHPFIKFRFSSFK